MRLHQTGHPLLLNGRKWSKFWPFSARLITGLFDAKEVRNLIISMRTFVTDKTDRADLHRQVQKKKLTRIIELRAPTFRLLVELIEQIVDRTFGNFKLWDFFPEIILLQHDITGRTHLCCNHTKWCQFFTFISHTFFQRGRLHQKVLHVDCILDIFFFVLIFSSSRKIYKFIIALVYTD